MASRPLTPKQEAFCIFVLAGNNQSDAYRKAYKCGGMKAKTVNEKASRMMGQGKIRARVTELMSPVIDKAQMTRTEWMNLLTACCRFDPRKMFDTTGRLKAITELDENEAAAIRQYELHEELPDPDGSRKELMVKIKFLDRLNALALLGKACHWYADRERIGETDGGPMRKTNDVNFIRPSNSPEETYLRMVTGY